jgi:hypothetical protein
VTQADRQRVSLNDWRQNLASFGVLRPHLTTDPSLLAMTGHGPDTAVMTREELQHWTDSMYPDGIDQASLFQLIASLSGCFDRSTVIETVGTILATKPVESGNCVRFDDVAIVFDRHGRISNIHRIIDGLPATGA